MNEKEKNDVYYVCCLIEFIGRQTKNKRSEVVKKIGKEGLQYLYKTAEVNHCLTFEQVSDEVIEKYNIHQGEYDTVSTCKYTVPSFMAIGKDYRRLVEDVQGKNTIVDTIYNVFTSFISDAISNFNTSTYYSSREYLSESYKAGYLLED